jgi:hypothetical protein
MEKILLLLLASVITPFAFAQDIIVTKDGKKIETKVTEINENDIKYKKFDNLSGPSYSMKKYEIASILYENGQVEVFKEDTPLPLQQQSVVTGNSTKENESLNFTYAGARKMYISLGAGVGFLGKEASVSGKFELGVFLHPNHLLSFDFNGGTYGKKQVGSFYYGPDGKPTNIGKVHYQYSNFIFFTNYSYVLKISNHVQWRIGPSMGLFTISAALSFEPSDIKNLPSVDSKTKYAFAGGLNTGFTFNLGKNKRWFLDLGWRVYGHTGISFESRRLHGIYIFSKKFSDFGNQVNLSVGWRFCKARERGI